MNADMKWLDNPEVFRVNQLDLLITYLSNQLELPDILG